MGFPGQGEGIMKLSHFHAAAFGFFVASIIGATAVGNGVLLFSSVAFAIGQVLFFKRVIRMGN